VLWLADELHCRPVRVSTNSEPLLDEDRQAIAGAWDVPVHNLWGSTEIGVQAVGLRPRRGTAHLRRRGWCSNAVDEKRSTGGSRRTGGANTRHRAGQPHVPVHSL